MKKIFLCILTSMSIMVSMSGVTGLQLSAQETTGVQPYRLPISSYWRKEQVGYWWWEWIPAKKDFYIGGSWQTLYLQQILDGPGGPLQTKLAIYTGRVYVWD